MDNILIKTLLITILVLILINSIALVSVFGWFVSKEVAEIYMDLKSEDIRLNEFNEKILSLNNGKSYIVILPINLFAKYHINNIGIVPRFSKLHKKIDEYYKEANKY